MTEPFDAVKRAVFTVLECNQPQFDARLKHLNAKAAKFGIEPIRVVESELIRYEIYWDELSGSNSTRPLRESEPPRPGCGVMRGHRVEVAYPTIKLGQWQMVAQIEAVAGGNLVFTVTQDPGDQREAGRRRDCPMGCDHCNTARRRNLSYLLREDGTGAYKQVGGSCVEDFTGVDPGRVLLLESMAKFAGAAGEDIDELARPSRPPSHLELREYLVRVLFLAQTSGFVSTAQAQVKCVPPSWADAKDLTARNATPKQWKTFLEAAPALSLQADALVAWVAQMNPRSEYEHNLKLLMGLGDVKLDRKHLAVVAGAVPAYQRHQRQQALNQHDGSSCHVGEAGVAMETTLQVYHVATYTGYFGVQQRVNLLDAGGNRLSWKTAAAPADLVDTANRDRPFRAGFKVKKHDHYQGASVTEVTHLKFKGWCPEPRQALDAASNVVAESDNEEDCMRMKP